MRQFLLRGIPFLMQKIYFLKDVDFIMLDISHTVCFTGHREIAHSDIATRLDATIKALINKGYRYFRAGGAPGFDTEFIYEPKLYTRMFPHKESNTR